MTLAKRNVTEIAEALYHVATQLDYHEVAREMEELIKDHKKEVELFRGTALAILMSHGGEFGQARHKHIDAILTTHADLVKFARAFCNAMAGLVAEIKTDQL